MTAILVIFALVCFAVIALVRPVWAIAAFLFLLPTYQVRFSLAGIPTTFLEMLFAALFLLWLVGMNRVRFQRVLHVPWRWLLVALFASAALAVAVSPDKHAAGLLKAYFVEPVLFFCILWERIRTERNVRILLYALGCSVVVAVAVAVLQYAHLVPSPDPWNIQAPRRVVGVFDYPNALALYVAPLFGIAAAFLFVPSGFRKRTWEYIFLCGVAIFSILGVLLSVSRGGMIGIAAGALFIACISPFRKKLWLAIAAFSIVLLTLPVTRTTITNIATRHDTSSDVRIVLWQGTWRLLEHRPILGAGLGGFPHYYSIYRLPQHTELLLFPHNIVLNFWVEIGLAGLVVVTILFFLAFRTGTRILRQEPTSFARSCAAAALAALVILIAHGMVDAPFFKNDLAMQFFFLFGLVPIASLLQKAGRT